MLYSIEHSVIILRVGYSERTINAIELKTSYDVSLFTEPIEHVSRARVMIVFFLHFLQDKYFSNFETR